MLYRSEQGVNKFYHRTNALFPGISYWTEVAIVGPVLRLSFWLRNEIFYNIIVTSCWHCHLIFYLPLTHTISTMQSWGVPCLICTLFFARYNIDMNTINAVTKNCMYTFNKENILQVNFWQYCVQFVSNIWVRNLQDCQYGGRILGSSKRYHFFLLINYQCVLLYVFIRKLSQYWFFWFLVWDQVFTC